MKKFFSILLITILSFNICNIYNVSAAVETGTFTISNDSSEKSTYIKNLIIAKYSLGETTKGTKYMDTVDSFIEANKDNKAKLEKLNSRLEIVLNSSDLEDIDDETVIYLINYMYAKTNIALMNIEETEQSLVDSLDDEDDTEEEITDIENISEEEKEMVENKIIKLQLNLLENSEDLLENLIDEFEDISSSKEVGDFDLSFFVDFEEQFNIDSKISISDYESITDTFDSRFKGEINAIFKESYGENTAELQINSFIDLITTDGNTYLLLKDFEVIKQEGVEAVQNYLDVLAEIAENNEYVKFEDPEAYESIQILKSLDPSKIIDEGKDVLSESMFEAYKKDEDKYYIKPTKYACDFFKSSLNKFDPFYGDECSDSQYEDMVNDLEKNGNLYITFDGDVSTIGYEGTNEYGYYDYDGGYISFDENEVKEVYYSIIPNQETYPNEKLELSYKNEESLNLYFYANSGEFYIDFSSELDNNNSFDSALLELSLGNLSTNIELDNNNINGDFELINESFDYTTYEYVKSSTISGTISGETDSSNELEELSISYNGVDTDNQEFLNGSFDLNEYKFSFKNDYSSDTFVSTIDMEGQFDDKTFISDLDSTIETKNKQASFNYDTWEYEYSEDFDQVFLSEIKIEDREIKATTSFVSGDDFSLELEHEGKYSDEEFKLETSILISSEELVDYNGKLKGRMEIDIDQVDNNNDYYFLFELNSGTNELINIEMENNGKKYNSDDYEVETPSNIIDSTEIFDTDFYNNYYYYGY